MLGPHRIVAVNTRTGAIETLVTWPRPINSFDLSADGRTVLFVSPSDGAEAKEVYEKLMSSGFTMRPDQGALSLMGGSPGARYSPWANEEIIAIRDGGPPRKLPVPRNSAWAVDPMISPDGRWAVLVGASLNDKIPAEWDRYTDGLIRERIGAARDSRLLDYASQRWLANLETGEVRPLHAGPHSTGKVVWSPDSHRVVVAPVFPPVENADEKGLAGRVAAVIDVAGNFHILPFELEPWKSPLVLEWEDERTVSLKNVDGSGGRARWDSQAWTILKETSSARSNVANAFRRVDISVAQDLNRPPVLTAVDSATGERREVLEIDPGQSKFRLGRVKVVSWTDKAGRTWKGRLYLPVDYRAGDKYPLVINCADYELPGSEFSLIGWELGGSPLSNAQPLAARNIAVLAGYGLTAGPRDWMSNKIEEYPAMRSAIEGAVLELTQLGYIDPARVGLVGWSRIGSYVLHTITNSDHPFAASYISDNVKYTYEQYVALPLLATEMGRIYGTHPFGAGLKTWLERSPNFLADHIYGPVMLETASSLNGVVTQWEFYSLLNHLKKPVELYVVPEARDRGSHPLILPRQKLASIEQVVDWFDFWLNGREQADPAEAVQYQRWRKLRQMHEEDKKKPRPPRLQWEAREVPREMVVPELSPAS